MLHPAIDGLFLVPNLISPLVTPAYGEVLLLVLYVIFYLFTPAYGAFAYIGTGLGGSRMMRKAGGSKPWMFWIPVANVYAMGALADREAELRGGRSTRYRKTLLGWNIAVVAMVVVPVLSLIPFIVVAASNQMLEESGAVRYPEAEAEALVLPALIFLFVLLAFLAVTVVYTVFYYIVLYRIYRLFAPKGAAGLTVLSVFVNGAVPVIFLILSGREPVQPVREASPSPDPDGGSADFYSL